MEWLKDYEGGRGVAYLLAIVGMIAPTMLALFSLAQPMFLAMEWIKLLLLCASIGGVSIAICVSATITERVLDEMSQGVQEIDADYRAALMKEGLTLGSIQGLACQLLALIIAVATGKSFAGFLQVLCLVLLGALLISFVPALLKKCWKTIRRKR